MKSRILPLALLMAVLAPVAAKAGWLSRNEIKTQNEIFKQWWGSELQWRFDELPLKGKVPAFRMPYAGYIYPDKQGGCAYALRRYDMAFNRGMGSAAAFERHDIAIHKDKVERPGGLFGLMTVRRLDTPDWAGHCNGWTAAAIRHAEPRKSVRRNGVVFTPADIKALLAELYVYNDTITLGGDGGGVVHPATLHVVLANWLGRGSHPIGMDSSVGKEVWNYPIYGYSAAAASRSGRRVEVRMNLGYVYMLDQEFQRAPKNNRFLGFHYSLELDSAGRIIGGDYYPDSQRLDMLWVPRQLFQGGATGNKPGNPYVSAKEVLAMWRESTPEDVRKQWWNIDPTEADRIEVPEENVEEVDAAPAIPQSVVATPEVTTPDVTGETPTVTPSVEAPVTESTESVEAVETVAPEGVEGEAAEEIEATETTPEITPIENPEVIDEHTAEVPTEETPASDAAASEAMMPLREISPNFRR
jgi:hypothetical protein